MDSRFIFALIFLAAALVMFKVSHRITRTTSRPQAWVRYAPVILFGVGTGLFLLSCLAVVKVNTVSFVNNFGRPSGVLSNGWNMKAPWTETVSFDGSRQFLRFEGGGDPDNNVFPCVNVRLSSNATACLSGVAEWQMLVQTPDQQTKALQLYRDYKSFDRLRDNYMKQRVQTALGKAFADHNPLITSQNLTLDQLNLKATAALREVVGDTVTIYTVSLLVPDYDETTDAAIAKQQAEFANTATAEQKVKTAEQEALAATRLQAALAGSPEYTTNKCLDIAREAITKGQAVEPGLCMGANSSVLLSK